MGVRPVAEVPDKASSVVIEGDFGVMLAAGRPARPALQLAHDHRLVRRGLGAVNISTATSPFSKTAISAVCVVKARKTRVTRPPHAQPPAQPVRKVDGASLINSRAGHRATPSYHSGWPAGASERLGESMPAMATTVSGSSSTT